MYVVDKPTNEYDELPTMTCSNIIHMGRTLSLHSLEMELGEAVFLCGSRRFGYHLPESDMDITIYFRTLGNEKLLVNHLIYLDMFDFIRKLQSKDITDTSIIKEDNDGVHKWDRETTGATVFHIPAFDIHLRVHTNLSTFQEEKEVHNLLEKRLPKSTIDKIKYARTYDDSNHPIKGSNIYKFLKERYVDNDPSVFTRLWWWITSYLHHPKEFM